MEQLAYDFTVRGIVQGVGFRYFTSDMASRLGVSGFVKNETDGSVRGHVEGEPGNVQQFFGRLEKGPPMSRVNQVIKLETAIHGMADFEIRYG